MNPLRPGLRTCVPPTLLLLVASQSGCLEQSGDLLQGGPLPALGPALGPVSGSSADRSRPTDPVPSTGAESPWSRADWSPTPIVVPMASVRHQPTYVDHPLPSSGTTTAGRMVPPGVFPTADLAPTVEVDEGDVLFSAILAPFGAVLDLVGAPVRMVCTPPCSVLEGPEADWALVPTVTIDEGETR